jgi:flavin-dependent dehydrogenase
VLEYKDFDVVVIGGGPAGSTAAALLASWGRSVIVLHHQSRQPSLAESLPPSARKLFRFLGQLEAVDAQRFHPNYGNISRWAGQDGVARTAEAGYHVSRATFDNVLRNHARAQGASIAGAQLQRVALAGEGPPADGLHEIVAIVDRDAASYRARFVLDCSGRTGIVARRGLRRADAGYRTLAIAAEWDCPDWPEQERTQTLIDSYRNGWAWSVPLSPTRRQCTVMVDADLISVRKASLATLYRAELRKASSIEARLGQADQISEPWACDASLYRPVRAADSTALLVGDAASFIEPLSSAGVKKALASAWRAAVVVNTALNKPDMQSIAFDYHDRREQQVYQECLRRSAGFFNDAASAHNDAFWSARATSSWESEKIADEGIADIRLADDGAVREVFETLRDAPTLMLTPASHLELGRIAVIEDREVVMRDAVVVPGIGEPVRFVGGVNLPELIRIAAGCRDLSSLIASYHDRVAPVDPRDLLVGMSVLVARGLMLNRGVQAQEWSA